MRVLLVCSSGGHLGQLHALEEWWGQHERAWVTFDSPDAESLLEGEQVYWAYHPTTRNIPNLLRNSRMARTVLKEFRPDLVVSTGAAVAVPYFALAVTKRIRTAYLEVFDRIDSATLTGKICYPLADHFLLQWDEQLALYPEGVVVGRTM